MASIVKRKHKHKTTYLCFIRRKGFKTLRKTFQTRQDAQKWSRYIERNLVCLPLLIFLFILYFYKKNQYFPWLFFSYHTTDFLIS